MSDKLKGATSDDVHELAVQFTELVRSGMRPHLVVNRPAIAKLAGITIPVAASYKLHLHLGTQIIEAIRAAVRSIDTDVLFPWAAQPTPADKLQACAFILLGLEHHYYSSLRRRQEAMHVLGYRNTAVSWRKDPEYLFFRAVAGAALRHS